MTIFKIIKRRLEEALVDGKTLVYFASGSAIKEAYRNLPYENIILVDNAFRRDNNTGITSSHKITIKDGIICLGMDCAEAVFLLKRINRKVDAFVSINEGIYEGGGFYAINSDTFLGYSFPILADKFVHIGYRNYYAGTEYHHLKEHWLDLPYEKNWVLTETDPDYISPSIFTSNSRYASNAEVTLLSNKSKRQHSFYRNGKEFSIIHSSIWNDMQTLDAAFVRFENRRQKDVILKVEQSGKSGDINIFPIQVNNRYENYTTYDLDTILSISKVNRWKHIGLVPNQGNYSNFFEMISSEDMPFLEKVSIYHLNENDYSELYKIQ